MKTLLKKQAYTLTVLAATALTLGKTLPTPAYQANLLNIAILLGYLAVINYVGSLLGYTLEKIRDNIQSYRNQVTISGIAALFLLSGIIYPLPHLKTVLENNAKLATNSLQTR